jgi:DNA-binding NtrC family response regulator
MHILLVEDEPELSRLAAETMENMGHQVTMVSCVHDAMSFIEDHEGEVDLVIADHRLPDGWGVALCIEFRVKYPKLKTCVVSGCLNHENIAMLQEYGIPFWQKPVLYSTVLRKMTAPKPPEVKKDNVIPFEHP